MGKVKLSLLILVFILLFPGSQNYTLSSVKKDNLFDDIVTEINGEACECGLTANFVSNGEEESICKNIYGKLQIDGSPKLNITKKKDTYCIEFDNGKLKGYIEDMRDEKNNFVTISISENIKKNNLTSLNERVSNAIEKKRSEVKYFQYLKAKLPMNDLKKVNNEIINLLKKKEASNIDTLPINGGYSTVAYTKRYEIRRENDKWEDFNYALCNYNSGNYIIIGTPEIITSY